MATSTTGEAVCSTQRGSGFAYFRWMVLKGRGHYKSTYFYAWDDLNTSWERS